LKAKLAGRAAEGPPGTVTSIERDSVAVACRDGAISVQLVRLDGEVVAGAKVLQVGQRLLDG